MLVGYDAIQKDIRNNYRQTVSKVDARAILDHYNARNITETSGRNGKELLHSCLIDQVTPHHSHGDNSPSASMNVDKLWYNCWSYGSGDILWFIQEMEDCNRFEALQVLSRFVEDTDEPRKSAIETIKEIYDNGSVESAPIPKYSSIILEPWLRLHPYMTEYRRFNIETLQRYCIGYDEEYEQIVLPHFWKDKLVGYQKRRQNNPEWPTTPSVDKFGNFIPKYKNSKDFPKDKTLFNYDMITKRRHSSVTLVESVMSVLRAESWCDEGNSKFDNVLATFGAKITNSQLEILRGFEEVTVWLDNDPAGWYGTIKLYNQLKNYCNVYIVDTPSNLDLGDMDLAYAEEVFSTRKPGSLSISNFIAKVAKL